MGILGSDYEFLLTNPEFADILSRFGTKLADVRKLTESTLQDNGKISFDEITDVVFRLNRSAVTANITDIIDLREQMRKHVECTISVLQAKLFEKHSMFE